MKTCQTSSRRSVARVNHAGLEDLAERFRLEGSDRVQSAVGEKVLEGGHDVVERRAVDFADVEGR